MRLDDDKLAALRRWGEELRQASTEKYAAAGRAILMLVEEIDQLQIELRHARQDEGSSDAADEDLQRSWIEALRRQK
ncbi:MAG: hypothetical protein ACJ75G_13325 [Gaiellaceae bacterium]